MEEQRIKNLEEELKVLKNQIKAVLLDIKEQLATGGGSQSSAPPWAGAGGPSAAPKMENKPDFATMLASGTEKVPADTSSVGRVAEDARPSLSSILDHAAKSGIAAGETNGEGRVDLLTISVLAQWLSRAAETVSKEQIGKLVEIYDITGNLPPRLKQAILLLADLYGNGNKAVEDDEDIPASVSLQLLIELDSLLRYRTGALESVVLSMLLDKKQGNRRGV